MGVHSAHFVGITMGIRQFPLPPSHQDWEIQKFKHSCSCTALTVVSPLPCAGRQLTEVVAGCRQIFMCITGMWCQIFICTALTVVCPLPCGSRQLTEVVAGGRGPHRCTHCVSSAGAAPGVVLDGVNGHLLHVACNMLHVTMCPKKKADYGACDGVVCVAWLHLHRLCLLHL